MFLMDKYSVYSTGAVIVLDKAHRDLNPKAFLERDDQP